MHTAKIILCGAMLIVAGQSHAGTEGLSRQVKALNTAMKSYKQAVDHRVGVLTTDLNTVNANLAAYKTANDAAVSALEKQLGDAKVCGNAGKLYAPDGDSADSNGCLAVQSTGGGSVGGGNICMSPFWWNGVRCAQPKEWNK